MPSYIVSELTTAQMSKAFRDSEYLKRAENEKEAKRIDSLVPFKPLYDDLKNLILEFHPKARNSTVRFCDYDVEVVPPDNYPLDRAQESMRQVFSGQRRRVRRMIARTNSDLDFTERLHKFGHLCSIKFGYFNQYYLAGETPRLTRDIPTWAVREYRQIPKLPKELYDLIYSFHNRGIPAGDRHVYEINQFWRGERCLNRRSRALHQKICDNPQPFESLEEFMDHIANISPEYMPNYYGEQNGMFD